MNQHARIVDRHAGQLGERRLEKGEVAEAKRAQDEGGGETAIDVQLPRQALGVAGRHPGGQQPGRGALADLQDEVAGGAVRQVVPLDEGFAQRIGGHGEEAFEDHRRQCLAAGERPVNRRVAGVTLDDAAQGIVAELGPVIADKPRHRGRVRAVDEGVGDRRRH